MPKKIGRRKIKGIRGTVSKTKAVPTVGRASSMQAQKPRKLKKKRKRGISYPM